MINYYLISQNLYRAKKTKLLFLSLFYVFNLLILNACGNSNSSKTSEDVNQENAINITGKNVSGNLLSIIKTAGGTVEGSGINCGTTCSGYYKGQENVTLIATPESGFIFNGWEGDCAGMGSCEVQVNIPKEVRASFTAINTADLCIGLITDKSEKIIQPVTQPNIKESYIDPTFGTRITRITQSESSRPIKPMYSTIQAWNSDESYFILYEVGKGHRLYSGKNYDFISYLDISPSDIEGVYWHFSDPNTLTYIDNNEKKVIQYHISIKTKNTIIDLKNTCNSNIVSGGDIQMSSWDSNNIGFRCNGKSGKIAGYIDINQKTTHVFSSKDKNYSEFIAPMPSASGKYFYMQGDILDKNLNLVRKLDLSNALEHANLGKDHLGEDVYLTAIFDPGAKGCEVGSVVMHNLASGACDVLAGPSTGLPYPPPNTHISAQAYKNTGWVAVSTIGEGDNLPSANAQKKLPTTIGEIYLVNTDPSQTRFCRVAHHRTWGKSGNNGYWAEPHPAISPTGTRILFSSDFHNTGRTDTYVVELPSFAK